VRGVPHPQQDQVEAGGRAEGRPPAPTPVRVAAEHGLELAGIGGRGVRRVLLAVDAMDVLRRQRHAVQQGLARHPVVALGVVQGHAHPLPAVGFAPAGNDPRRPRPSASQRAGRRRRSRAARRPGAASSPRRSPGGTARSPQSPLPRAAPPAPRPRASAPPRPDRSQSLPDRVAPAPVGLPACSPRSISRDPCSIRASV
jgi:hypothetical protein